MSRLIATSADEMLSGTNSGVMGAFYGADDETPGVVVLGSLNAFPNGDLTDVDERGRLRGMKLGAPPAPDSWNVYMRQTTRINASGAHVVLKGTPMLRQNEYLLATKRHTYQQDHPLLTNASLPDLGKDEPTDLAPPLDAPRVEVITTSGNIGYPAGSYWCSYFGIVGNPIGSPRLTNCAPAVQITGVVQGQVLLFYLPDEVPDSWDGIGFCVGPTASTMKVQKRLDLRDRRVVDTTVDRGPYRRDGVTIDTVTNRTKMGAKGQFGAPKAWRTHSSLNLMKGTYLLSYRLLTKQGPTASQGIGSENVASDHKGECVAWVPPAEAIRQPGVIGWLPEFRGADGKWYTFEDAKGNGYSLNHPARLTTKKTDKDNWKSQNRPVKSNRTTKDASGVSGPTDPMEPPLAQGASAMAPGRYAVRLTTASEKEGMESRPTPRTVVTLRDSGLAAGGAASFVTDQMIRVYRPMPQIIRNSRLMEVDPVTGTQDLHWERFSPGGVTITAQDGFVSIADTSLGTTSQNYRRTSIEPVDPTRFWAVRFRMALTRYGSGTARVRLRFLDSSKALISSVALEDFRSVEDVHVKYTIGPLDSSAHYDMPANTAFFQAQIEGIGASGDTRNLDFSVSNIGLWVGRATPRKLYDLVLAEDTPGRDVWPVPDTEDPTNPYPAGPYCRHVTNPTDPAKVRTPTYINQKGFEDNSATSGGWTKVETTGGMFSTGQSAALRGLYGARSDIGATSAASYGAYIWRDCFSASRSTFAVEQTMRVKALPSSGTAAVLGVTRDANLTSYLARVQLMSTGVLNLVHWNGSSLITTSTGITVQGGDDLRIELVFTGLRTSSGSVAIKVKRNDRPLSTPLTQSGINWSAANPGGNVYRVLSGLQNGSTATATARVFIDRIRITESGMNESTNVPGGMVEYWAPEAQPATDDDHLLTGARWPVKPGEVRTLSFYLRYIGISTPASPEGASLFNLVSYDSSGNPLKDHGYALTGLLGRDYWDRYSFTYTTASVDGGDDGDAAYVAIERNDVGDGVLEVMGFQDQVGSSATAFTNTNATSGFFQVVLKSTITGGPLGDDPNFTEEFLRMRAIATQALDGTGAEVTTTSVEARGAQSVGGLSSATWQTDIDNVSTQNDYVELKVSMSTTDATKSPEVRAVFVDAKRKQPTLTMEDGRDFHGGCLVYAITDASPIPNVVRKEYADGGVGVESVTRGQLPERVKLSIEALTPQGKRQIERNPATNEPFYRVEKGDTRWLVAMAPELTGSQEGAIDGTSYFDYVSDGLEADVIETSDL